MESTARLTRVSLVIALALAPILLGAADRAALVIGIDKYENLPASAQLSVAARDAQLLAATLSGLPESFHVTLLTDSDRESVSKGLDSFISEAKNAQCALVYFAGHGIEFHGENYLLVRDTKISAQPDEAVRRVKDRLYYETISLHKLMEDLHETGANLKIVILDACRDNPLEIETPVAGGTRSILGGESQGGLVRVTAPTGMLVSYSADEGQQANDGLFTGILAEQIKIPGSTLMEVFARTRSEVRERAAVLQAEGKGVIHEPAEYSKLDPSALRFSFVPGEKGPDWKAPEQKQAVGNNQVPGNPTMTNTRSAYETEKIVDTKAQLAEVESRMESERKRYQDALGLINKLTNNKRTAVVEGSPAYYQCMNASKVIKEIEDKAPEIKAEKARLQAVLKALGEPVGSDQ